MTISKDWINLHALELLFRIQAKVIGIDPALMDERVLSHANFTHVRARAADLRRKEFSNAKWLLADANIAPESTLDAIEDIVTHRVVNIQATLITVFIRANGLVWGAKHQDFDWLF